MINKYYKVKRCPKWNQDISLDKCKFGKECSFAHGSNELRCKYYQEGNCKFGNECYLIHDNDFNCNEKETKLINDDSNEIIKKDVITDLEMNKYVENIKENNQLIQFDINIEEIKKKNIIDWTIEYSDIASEDYNNDPFL